MSPPLDSPLTEKSARTRTDTRTTPGAFRGTDGSNPVPSSGESANPRSLSSEVLARIGTTVAPRRFRHHHDRPNELCA
jgi:hypothetical protein